MFEDVQKYVMISCTVKSFSGELDNLNLLQVFYPRTDLYSLLKNTIDHFKIGVSSQAHA